MPLFNPPPTAGAGSGTVTSVGLTTPGLLDTVSGSPVTSSGTLALALKTQAANAVLAGPTSGGAANPTLRALVAADVPAVNPSALSGSGTVPLAALSGLTTSQLSATAAITGSQLASGAAIVAGQIASVNPSALTGSGTVPLAALTGITTSQLSASAALVAGQIASVNPSVLTGSGTVPLAGLSGLTTGQLSASAGIVGSQLDAAAAIASGQITSLAASKIAGTNTLPDGVLSTNVPLLNAANTFTAAQTVGATVAGVLAQVNNASTTGAGLAIGSTTIASAGAGKIAPALSLTQAPAATANYGSLSIGSGPFDGATAGFYAGSSSGGLLALNAASGFGGDLGRMQVAGVTKFVFGNNGQLTCNTAYFFVRSRSSAASIAEVDYFTFADASSAAFTLTLPAASTNGGRPIYVKKTDSSANAVTIARAGSDTIEGATSMALSAQYNSVLLVSGNGTTWYKLATT